MSDHTRRAFLKLAGLAVTALAVGVRLTAPLRRWVNVRDYGAKGDGVTNDSRAFRAAAADLAEGGTIFIPAGTYRITDLPRGMRYSGEGGRR